MSAEEHDTTMDLGTVGLLNFKTRGRMESFAVSSAFSLLAVAWYDTKTLGLYDLPSLCDVLQNAHKFDMPAPLWSYDKFASQYSSYCSMRFWDPDPHTSGAASSMIHRKLLIVCDTGVNIMNLDTRTVCTTIEMSFAVGATARGSTIVVWSGWRRMSGIFMADTPKITVYKQQDTTSPLHEVSVFVCCQPEMSSFAWFYPRTIAFVGDGTYLLVIDEASTKLYRFDLRTATVEEMKGLGIGFVGIVSVSSPTQTMPWCLVVKDHGVVQLVNENGEARDVVCDASAAAGAKNGVASAAQLGVLFKSAVLSDSLVICATPVDIRKACMSAAKVAWMAAVYRASCE